MFRLQIIVVYVTIFTASLNAAKILGVYPTPSISHQVVFRALTLELVKRGHEVVTITTDPAFKNTTSPANLTEIDISSTYELFFKLLADKEFTQYTERGVILDSRTFLKMNSDTMKDFLSHIFHYGEVKQLLNPKNQFDLMILEGLYSSPLIYSKIFNVPAVLFSSFYGTAGNYEVVGAVSRHPLLHPSFSRTKFRNLSILEKIREIYTEIDFSFSDVRNERIENEFLVSQFGSGAPTIAELKKNVALLLVNSHPLLDGNRPVPPGVVYLGGLHLQPLKELPQVRYR